MRHACAAVLALLLTGGPATIAIADPLDDLARSIERFRGIGDPEVLSYRVPVDLPDEEEDAVTLLEWWRSPASLSLAARDPSVPKAVTRGWALYLEPVYVARASLLGIDLAAGAESLRRSSTIESAVTDSGRRVVLELPAKPEADLPRMLRDLDRLEADLDGFGRITRLVVDLAETEASPSETILLTCSYADGARPLPDEAEWTLPSGDEVTVSTEFREEGGRVVPAARTIRFPSRWDPGETERIHLVYGPYELQAGAPREGDAARWFRFDANGLVPDAPAP